MTWETEEGGKLAEFKLHVDRAFFGTDQRYNNGQSTLLTWEGTTDIKDENGNPDEKLGTFNINLPLGKGWETADGLTVTHDSGKPDKGFNKSSIYGRVIDRAIKEFGLGDLLAKRGDPTEAKVWEDLTFDIKRETIDFGSGLESRSRFMPTAFLGEGIGALGSVSGNGTAAVTAAATVANPAVIKAKLKALAKSSTTHAEFVDKAMELDGVATNDELVGAVVDEAGLYAEARA